MKEFLKERGAVPQAICTLGAALTPCLSRLQACKRPQCWLEQANMDEDTRLSHELFKPLEQAEQAKPKFGTLDVIGVHWHCIECIREVNLPTDFAFGKQLDDLLLTWERCVVFDRISVQCPIIVDHTWQNRGILFWDHPCTGGDMA